MQSNTSNQTLSSSNDPFRDFFSEAEQTVDFWVSTAKLRFTEEMLARMDDLNISRSELASKLEVDPAQITRLCSGRNNFTLKTMVSIARALDCEFRSHLQPKGVETHWIDVMECSAAEPVEIRQQNISVDFYGDTSSAFEPFGVTRFDNIPEYSHVCSGS